jgi:hypothetical protein
MRLNMRFTAVSLIPAEGPEMTAPKLSAPISMITTSSDLANHLEAAKISQYHTTQATTIAITLAK